MKLDNKQLKKLRNQLKRKDFKNFKNSKLFSNLNNKLIKKPIKN